MLSSNRHRHQPQQSASQSVQLEWWGQFEPLRQNRTLCLRPWSDLWECDEHCCHYFGTTQGFMEFMEIIYSPRSVMTMVTILKGVRTCCWGPQSPFSALERSQVHILVMIMMKWKSFWQVSMMWMPSTIISAMKLQAFQDVKRLSKDFQKTCALVSKLFTSVERTKNLWPNIL